MQIYPSRCLSNHGSKASSRPDAESRTWHILGVVATPHFCGELMLLLARQQLEPRALRLRCATHERRRPPMAALFGTSMGQRSTP